MKSFRLRTIKSKVLCVVLMLSIIPLILLGVISFQVSRNAVSQQVEEIHAYNISTYDRNITLVFENLRQVCSDFLYGKGEYSAEKLISLLDKEEGYYGTLSVYRQAELKKLFNNQVSILAPSNMKIKEVVLDNLNDLRFRQYYQDGLSYTDVVSGERDQDYGELYEKALLSADKEIFVRADEESFVYMKIIYSLKKLKPVGYLAVNVESSVLQTILPDGNELKNAAYVVVDTHEGKESRIVFSSGSIYELGQIVESYYDGTLSSIWKAGCVANKISGWDILYLVNKEALSEKAAAIGAATIGMVLLSIAVVFLLGLWLSWMINRPLDQLGRAIRKVNDSGEYTITEDFGDDEIGRIGNQFKDLVEQNLSLKDGLYQTEIRQKEAELAALQAQINPHFLYNTLDTIYLMTQMGRGQEAGKMILALSEIFKTSLNQGNEVTRIREEMRHIENYLYIQKMRYGERIHYSLDIAEEILELRIMKLILQPVIENGICHGLEPKPCGGTISLVGRCEENDLIFIITDDGVGMEKDAWKTGYGLKNVRQRIHLYYGENYGMQIDSELGKGTRVTIRLALLPEPKGWSV